MIKLPPGLLEDFAGLIAIPTISSIDPARDMSNREAIDLLANRLDDLGFCVETMPVADDPVKLNLIARLGEGENGLVLSGHIDTVPYDPSAWTQDPFVLTEKDERLYGLGAADMKCFFPLVIEVVRQLELKSPRQPLYVLATADEESTMEGARRLAGSGRTLGRHALIGEPTGLVPARMHKGIIMEAIRLSGRAGHSSDPSLGISALEGMHAVIGALMEWRDELQSRYRNDRFSVPYPTLNFGSIHGGDNPNRICAECVLTIDLRLLPEMEFDRVRSELHSRVGRAIEGSGLVLSCNALFNAIPGMQTDGDAEIVRLVEKLSGRAAGTVAFGTEGTYLNAMGMETVILGPGNIEQAHQADEFIPMEHLPPMMDILSRTIRHFCLEGR